LSNLAFWICLIAAAGIYAAVALSPKTLAYVRLQNQCFANQVHLVSLERQVQYLGRVAAALKSEPEFAAELARVEFDAVRPGDERIPVDRRLSINAPVREPAPYASSLQTSWTESLLEPFAHDRSVRVALLAIAGAMVLTAFTFLIEPSTNNELATRRSAHDEAGV
jgi:cell division protein FtsB